MRNFLILVLIISTLLIIGIIFWNSSKTEYPESYDVVEAKYRILGFDALNDKEKAIYSIWWLEAEVNNGGFHQYFWNSAGDNANLALLSLNKIGAIKTAELLKQAIEIAFSGSLPLIREDRQNQLEVDEYTKIEALGDLDDSFYEYTEDFHKMLNEYSVK
ncbi:DMP19 family protein [Catenovulum maritimum]|uniref:DMP19 family protein n=1 Tax=Catenovulum maritimum TaxID=1513271 RepID=UPI0006612206|nr:DMP19 family protein [Catenovulum maritimum]